MRARHWGPALILLAAAAAFLQARSYDMWWHLETGEWILRERAVPRADPFSFTSAGAPWIDHEWLFQILLHQAHAWLGFHGIALLKGVAALGTAVIGWLASRRLAGERFSPSFALAVAAVAMVGLRPRLAERPEIVAFPFAAAVTALTLGLAARPAAPVIRLGMLAALTMLWVNLHASALLAPVLVIAVAVGRLGDGLRRHEPAWGFDAVRVLLMGAAIAAASLAVNPWGTGIYGVPLHIGEALAPSNLVNPEWLAPSWREFPLFFGAAAAALLAGAAALAGGVPLSGARLAVAGVLISLGASSIRHIGIFFAVLPLLAAPLVRTPRNPAARATAGLVACLASALWMMFLPPAGARIGVGVQPGRFPEEAAAFAASRLEGARLYNDVAAGGYLIWHAWPGRRVFVDGRNEVHAALLRDLSAALDDGAAWRALMDRHGVDGALVLYRNERVAFREAGSGRLSESTWSELHFPPWQWALVHWDDLAMVFVRRDGKFAPLAASSEYLSVRPEAFRVGLGGVRTGAPEGGAAGEIARRLAESPGCPLAKEMAAVYGSGHPQGRQAP